MCLQLAHRWYSVAAKPMTVEHARSMPPAKQATDRAVKVLTKLICPPSGHMAPHAGCTEPAV